MCVGKARGTKLYMWINGMVGSNPRRLDAICKPSKEERMEAKPVSIGGQSASHTKPKNQTSKKKNQGVCVCVEIGSRVSFSDVCPSHSTWPSCLITARDSAQTPGRSAALEPKPKSMRGCALAGCLLVGCGRALLAANNHRRLHRSRPLLRYHSSINQNTAQLTPQPHNLSRPNRPCIDLSSQAKSPARSKDSRRGGRPYCESIPAKVKK